MSRFNVRSPSSGCLADYILLLLSLLCKSLIHSMDKDMEAKIDKLMHGFVNELINDYPIPEDNDNDVHPLPRYLVHEENDDKIKVVDIDENRV
jgi:hypothetical protein